MARVRSYNSELVRKCAESGVRFDGRSGSTAREVQLSLIRGDDLAVAEVAMGDTRALCRVSLALVAPDASRPCEGKISVSVDVAHTVEMPHRGAALELGRVVERTVRDCGTIDKEALCIAGGAWVWAVSCNALVIANDGNLEDALVFACLAALRHARRPVVEVINASDEDEPETKKARTDTERKTTDGRAVVVRGLDEVEPLPLPLLRSPLTITFAVLGGADAKKDDDEDDGEEASSCCVVDPNLSEEAAASAMVTLGFDAHEDVCAVSKIGGEALSADLLIKCAKQAAKRAKTLHDTLKTELKAADDAWRTARTDKMRQANILGSSKPASSPS